MAGTRGAAAPPPAGGDAAGERSSAGADRLADGWPRQRGGHDTFTAPVRCLDGGLDIVQAESRATTSRAARSMAGRPTVTILPHCRSAHWCARPLRATGRVLA